MVLQARCRAMKSELVGALKICSRLAGHSAVARCSRVRYVEGLFCISQCQYTILTCVVAGNVVHCR